MDKSMEKKGVPKKRKNDSLEMMFQEWGTGYTEEALLIPGIHGTLIFMTIA